MPGIVALVSAISADVVARLADAGAAPLTDGRILLGRQHVKEQSYPPKIVFVPQRNVFGPRDTAFPSVSDWTHSSEYHAQRAQRSIASDRVYFEVNCWGAAGTPDPDNDFTATELLYVTLINSVRTLAVGQCGWTDGEWPDQQVGASQLMKVGHKFVFGIWIGTPIVEQPLVVVPVSSVQGTVGYSGASTDDSVVVNVP